MVRMGKYDSVTEYLQTLTPECTLPDLDANSADIIRFVAIICAYLLLRPYIIRWSASVQERHLKQAEQVAEAQRKQEMQADETRAKETIQWGRNARIQQRKVADKLLRNKDESDSEDEELKQLVQ
jgi:Protein trafficking PGA2